MDELPSSQKAYAELADEVMAYPRDAFELTAFSFDTNDPKEVAEMIGKFSSLVNKDILLANTSERMIELYQKDARLLTHLFSLAVRDAGVRPYFKVLYYGWKHELALTRTKDGKGMDLLEKVASMKPSRAQSGYGSELYPVEFQPQGNEGGLKEKFKKIFGL